MEEEFDVVTDLMEDLRIIQDSRGLVRLEDDSYESFMASSEKDTVLFEGQAAVCFALFQYFVRKPALEVQETEDGIFYDAHTGGLLYPQ
ncbi:MAG: hypothetical protein ABEI13_03865 [Candidatus Paceibacteria bacterium]